jgi:dihydrofolate reductase
MGAILVQEFITLDGVIENPAWSAPYGFDPKMGAAIGQIMGSSKALLIGRVTYELFAPSWSGRTAEDDPGAPFMNDSPKHVVSTTLENPTWNNTSLLGAYEPQKIQSLKDSSDGNIYVSGSATLVRGLLRDGLVDELHLLMYPLTLGHGARLFSDGLDLKLSLIAAETYDNGVVHLAYGSEKWPANGVTTWEL